ncbi:MAG TPA: pseudouridine synthase [Terriglobales bacterium]|nr:pseudouridine synthase [Terriglobales bacterium]
MTARGKSRKVGLARALSKLGYCSRSSAFVIIRSGRVQLNGRAVRDPEAPVRIEMDRVAVDGKLLASERKVYLMLNKPRGVVTTASDEKSRTTVYSLLPAGLPWIAPVGRLDMASEGLLLLTNDSEWGARITDPETHLEKTYHVQTGKVAAEKVVQSLMGGITTNEGERLRVKRAGFLRQGEKNCWIEIVLDEGKNRQIRRMLEALGLEVLRLVRVAIGPLQLGELGKGQTRELTIQEKERIDEKIAKNAAVGAQP